MAGTVSRLQYMEDAEIEPAPAPALPPGVDLKLEYQYEILDYNPPMEGMRAREGWQSVAPSGPDNKYVFHLPDGHMQVRVRCTYAEHPDFSSEPSPPRTFIVTGA